MKAKLYKGPFNGKTCNTDGSDELIFTGPKKVDTRRGFDYGYMFDISGHYRPAPRIEARYRIAMRVIQTGPDRFVRAPATHPDGSIFYEYVEGSKREF